MSLTVNSHHAETFVYTPDIVITAAPVNPNRLYNILFRSIFINFYDFFFKFIKRRASLDLPVKLLKR